MKLSDEEKRKLDELLKEYKEDIDQPHSEFRKEISGNKKSE